MIDKFSLEIARKNWIKASEDLIFKIITPYFIFINGKEKEVFAFLPEYGSSNGMIICLIFEPDLITDPDIKKYAKENNVYLSFANIYFYLKFNKEIFIEALEDWRKF